MKEGTFNGNIGFSWLHVVMIQMFATPAVSNMCPRRVHLIHARLGIEYYVLVWLYLRFQTVYLSAAL